MKLVIIEAPGKCKQVKKVFQEIGFNAKVIATRGHLFHIPPPLKDLQINSDFIEYTRQPKNNGVSKRIQQEALSATKVYIATDGDQEGEVIAWDVWSLIRKLPCKVMRVRFDGLDKHSVENALSQATCMDESKTYPGRVRSIVDRLIGSTFSGNGIAVGRVGTGLLSLVFRQRPATKYLKLVAPDKHNQAHWVTEIPIKGPITEQIATSLLEMKLPELHVTKSQVRSSNAVPNMSDVMIEAGNQLDLSPMETSKCMQTLYEAGRLSYPRAGSRGLSASARIKIERILNNREAIIDTRMMEENVEPTEHDAPHPLVTVDYNKDPCKLSQVDAVEVLISRGVIKAGKRIKIEMHDGPLFADHARSYGFGDEVYEVLASLKWGREVSSKYPGRKRWEKSKIIDRRCDTVLLGLAIKEGLGRPSTWAHHINTIFERNLLNQDLTLTPKGTMWLNRAPMSLKKPGFSRDVEKQLNGIHNSSTDLSTHCGNIVREIVHQWENDIKVPILENTKMYGSISSRELVSELGHETHLPFDCIRPKSSDSDFNSELVDHSNSSSTHISHLPKI
ncbi:DNA topoisomerase [Flexibacterium corallicola]|uniref:DNA topoisomerase n=1 Tax=Flexibacterium corallicola TaxID=3037259 RepID=UPI00286F1193|nr:toprim domain-containing protein [Pseudovibrio sp. M1P-2-3]